MSHSTILFWLEKLLASPLFACSQRHQQLLRYLVEQSINGNGQRLKGYCIGVEVFGRPHAFDPNHDSIVRVEIKRLRDKLEAYYQREGATDEVRFHLKKGGYEVIFDHKNQPAVASDNNTKAPRLLVMPLASPIPDPRQKYFADGFTDSLITFITNSQGFSVLPREISFLYRTLEKTHEALTNELAASHLLEGELSTVGRQVHLSIRLLSLSDAMCIWDKKFTFDIKDAHAIFYNITRNVASRLSIADTLPSNPEQDLEINTTLFGTIAASNMAFLTGLEQHWKYSITSISASKELFMMATECDSTNASAHAWLSRTLLHQWIMFWERHADHIEQAYRHAQIARNLNPALPITNTVYGWVSLWRKNSQDAIEYCGNAVELDPDNIDARLCFSFCLSACGHGAEALHHVSHTMQQTAACSPFQLYSLGAAHYALGDYSQAMSAWEAGCSMSDSFIPNHFYLCLLHTLLNEREQAEKKRNHIISLVGHNKLPAHSPWNVPHLEQRHEELSRLAGFIH